MFEKNDIVKVVDSYNGDDALMCIGFIKSVEWDDCAEVEIYEVEFPDFLNSDPCCLPMNHNTWYYAKQLQALKLVESEV